MKNDVFGENGYDHHEMEKMKTHIIAELIAYEPNSVVSKTLMRKTTGNVTISSIDAGEEVAERTSPFDVLIQIIDGTAQLCINNRDYLLNSGDGIVIPAHSTHCFNAGVQFKMISTIIKSGYED